MPEKRRGNNKIDSKEVKNRKKADDPKGADRRMARRVPVNFDVDYVREENFLMTKSASVTNLSSLGIFIRTDEPSEVNTTLNLRFTPPHSKTPIEVEGVVAWANKVKGDNPDYSQNGMGIEFVNLDDKTKELLVSLVKRIALLAEE